MYLSRTRAGRGSLLVLLFAIFAPTVHAALRSDSVSLTEIADIAGQAKSLSITKDGRILFCVDALKGLRIFDVSDSAAFDLIDDVETQGKANFGALNPDDSTLYIADGNAGLSVYDVRNPHASTLKVNLPLPGGSAEIVRAANDKVFVVQAGAGLTVINASLTTTPKVDKTVNFVHEGVKYFPSRLQASADGSVVCVLAKNQRSTRRLFVYNAATNMIDFSSEIEFAEDIALTRDGRRLFVSISEDSSDHSYSKGVHLFDFTNDLKHPVRVPSGFLIKGDYFRYGAYRVHLNQDDSRLYVTGDEFVVFGVNSNRELQYLSRKTLTSPTVEYFGIYPVVALEAPDGLSIYCAGGFGGDRIALVSLSSTESLEPSQRATVNLTASSSRIGMMTSDGNFALFLQRDPDIDKGKLIVVDVATSSQFLFTVDIAWPAESSNVTIFANVTVENLYITRITPSNVTVKYAIPFRAILSQYSTRTKPVLASAPPPSPPPPSPPPPSAPSDGSIRLVGGEDQYSGRVEYFYNNAWGTVCDDYFDVNEGKVICKQLGLEFDESRNASVYSYARYGQGTGSIYLDNLFCEGTESRLDACTTQRSGYVWNWWGWSYETTYPVIRTTSSVIGEHDCSHYEDASVRCSLPVAAPPATPSGDIRLVGGSNVFEGRVEIFHDSSWGTVCDDAFDYTDADVVCRQVGMKFSNGVMKASYWGSNASGSGPIYRDQTACVGTENRLIDCPANPIGTHDCSHSDDVYVRCVHDTLSTSASNTYTFPHRVDPANDVFDEKSRIWYAAANTTAVKVIDFGRSPQRTHVLNIVTESSSAKALAGFRLSGDGKALYIRVHDDSATTNADQLITVDVTDVSSMTIDGLGALNTYEPTSLATSTSGKLLVIVEDRSFTLFNISEGNKPIFLSTYVSATCASYCEISATINGDDSRMLLKHYDNYRVSEIIDITHVRSPILMTVVDGVYKDGKYYPDAIMHNESSYYVFSASNGYYYQPAHDVLRLVRVESQVQLFPGSTQVGSEFNRVFLRNISSIRELSAVSLAGTSDELSSTGLTFQRNSSFLSGTMKKAYAGNFIHVVLTYVDYNYGYYTYDKHAVFAIQVKSSVRAYMFGSQLTLSSAEPLLAATLEMPSNTNATFVSTDELAVQQTFSEGNRVVQLFGIQMAVNMALTQLRYHSLSPEAGVSAIALNVKVSDLLSPEMSLETLGVARFTLASLRYNAHPVVHGNASTVLRFTLGESFTYVFNRSTFSDADDQTLTYSLDQVHGEEFPAWLTFDKDNFKLVCTEDSKDGVTLNETTNRYELTKEMILSATDGYTKVSTRFTLALYNYRPQATRQTYATSMYVTKQQVIEFSNFFTDQDSNFGGSLRYRVREGDGKAAPFWVVINEDTGKLTLLPMAENFGTYDYVVTAYDGVNTETSITLNVVVDRTPMLKFFYYTTLMLTALGGLSTTYAMYKYFWIAKNMTRTRHNWGTRDPFIRNIDDLATHLVNYQIRVKTDKKNEIIDIHAVYALQMVQLAEPSWYLKCLSHNIRTWLSSKPLKDGRSVPQWLEIDKLKLTFGFVSSAFHAPSEAGMRYVLLVKEADGSTFDTLHIDLTLLKTADEEMGSQVVPPLKSPENNVAIRGQSQQTFLVTGQNLTPEQQASAVRIAQEALNNNRK